MSEENNSKNINLITLKYPKSPSSEAYRTLRTNIQFSTFDKKTQVIVVTSADPGEGKSTVSANLAVVMAQYGSKTLLLDCDQRKPRVHRIFNLSNEKGLSNFLAGKSELESNFNYTDGSIMPFDFFFDESELENNFNHTDIENLDIMTAGIKPPNPAELLGSKKMGEFINLLRTRYDSIILDTPPILMVTDAQLLCSYSDGCVLVVASGEAQREEAIKAKELLQNVNAKILGVVLNKVEESSRNKYEYYYQYNDNDEIKNKNKNKHEIRK